MRGGVSYRYRADPGRDVSSPRAWGCFPPMPPLPPLEVCLPHVRGGVSYFSVCTVLLDASSPRAWGCFSPNWHGSRHALVFPTCVGVFPDIRRTDSVQNGLPHVRGGVSQLLAELDCGFGSSPRAWGCFSIPDATGGLSRESSPRAWGCFELCGKGRKASCVFPTCVGVFLRRTAGSEAAGGLPHVRGGVS